MFESLAAGVKDGTASPLDAVLALAAMTDEQLLDIGQDEALAVVELTQTAMACLAAVQALGIEAFTRREDESLETYRRECRARGDSTRGVPVAEEVVPAMLAPVLHVAPRSAATLVGETRLLVGDLPLTFALARAGRLEISRARYAASEAALVSAPLREQFDRELVHPDPRHGRTPLADLSGGSARKRAARTAVRVDPDSAATRAELCRRDRFVRLTPGEVPGITNWAAALPSESSLLAWAAIDALAAEYVAADGTLSVGAARADAMTDLILRRATITTTIDLVVPAPTPSDVALPTIPRLGEKHSLRSGDDREVSRPDFSRPPVAGGLTGSLAEIVYLCEIRTRHQTVPKKQRSWRQDQTWPGDPSAGRPPSDCRVGVAHHRVGIILNTTISAWLADPDTRIRLHEADPVTGTLLRHDPTIYRPGVALARAVRARDGHCRFPGCTTDARRSQLDHVVRFPDGPTALHNLAALCTKHHAFKHHAGWTLTMTVSGLCTWSSPLGRSYTTSPTTTHDLAA